MSAPSTTHDPIDAYGHWFLAAIVLSAVAAATHVFATPEHFQEWVGYGLFFVTAAAAQGLYAVLLLFLGPRRGLLWAGIIGNALILGLYAVTRTVGIPLFGPEAGEVEAIGLLDAVATAAEIALIVCLVQMLRMRAVTERVTP